MAYTLQLGSFPYADGTIEEDQSIYIGNNRFVRVVSQSGTDRTMAAMYEADDVFSSSPTITTLKEQIIDETRTYYKFKLCKLGTGDVLIMFARNNSDNYTYYTIIGYDETNSEFTVPVSYQSMGSLFSDSNNDQTSIYQRPTFQDFSIFPYENTSVLMSARGYNDSDNHDIADLIKINDVYADNPTDANIIVYSKGSESLGINYTPTAIINKIIDGYWFINTNSIVYDTQTFSDEDRSACLINLANDNVIYTSRSGLNDIVKLDSDRYVAIGVNNDGHLSFRIENNIENVSNNSGTVFDPQTFLFNEYDENHRFYTYPLDRFHCLQFHTTENSVHSNSNQLLCNVLKIQDENWGEISSATLQNGPGYEILSTVTTTNVYDDEASRIHNANVLEFIDNTHFFVQTGLNTYEFVEISPASSS